MALLLATIAQLLLPKLLSIDDYGIFKAFTLYLGYTSLFHFGLKDGIYIYLCKWKANKKSRNTLFTALLYQQIIICMILIIIALFIPDSNYKFFLILLAIGSVITILVTYFDSVYQSLKEFRYVAVQKVVKEIFFLFPVVGLYFLTKQIKFHYVILILVVSSAIPLFFYLIKSKDNLSIISPYKWNILLLKRVYSRGSKLLIGNFGHQMNQNIDKLLASFFFSAAIFAIYSFGGMFFVLSNLLVTTVATVLLPFLFDEFKNDLQVKYVRIRKLYRRISVLYIPYFIVIFIVTKFFYKEYIDSIYVLALLSLALILNVYITLVHNNYFRVLNLESKFVKYNYIAIFGAAILMIGIHLLKFSYFYFALALSVMTLLRFILNEYVFVVRFKLRTFSVIIDSILYSGLSFIIVIIGYYIVKF